MTLTATELRSLIHYDPETGAFTWLPRPEKNFNRMFAGKLAGWRADCHYLMICINGVKFCAHRLAWLYMIGEWPIADIDHRDRDRANNRFSNLREASRTENLRNASLSRRNTTGFKGVTRRRDKWRAVIVVDRKKVFLGSYSDPAEAGRAYCEAAARYFGEFACDGFSNIHSA